MAGHDAGQALSAQQRKRGEPIRPRQGSEGPGKEEVGGHDRAAQWAHGTYHGGTEYVTERRHVAALAPHLDRAEQCVSEALSAPKLATCLKGFINRFYPLNFVFSRFHIPIRLYFVYLRFRL